MKRLCIVADDFGLTESVNQGILDVYLAGRIQGVALMIMADATDEAIALIKEHNIEHVGIHTSLFSFRKADRKQRSDFIEFFRSATDEQVKKAVNDEFELFEKLMGRRPEFIAPQWNMHGNLRVLKYVTEYALQYSIPMRIPRAILEVEEITDQNYAAEVYLKRAKVHMPDHMFCHVLGADAMFIKDDTRKLLEQVQEGESIELIFHPGYNDQETLEVSSLNYERTRDLAILSDNLFFEQLKSAGFVLVPYTKL